MRIISKFRDYYDIGLSQGIDKDLVFVRKTEQINFDANWITGRDKKQNPFSDYISCDEYQNICVRKIMIGFCGKIYPCIHLTQIFNNYNNDKESYCYSIEAIDKFYKTHLSKKQYKDYVTTKTRSWRTSFTGTQQEKYAKWFKDRANLNHESYFIDNKMPVFVAEAQNRTDSCVVHLPELKKYEFYKAVDSYTAFQELSMYISGVLGTGNPTMVDIDDKYRIAGHGFDRFSFKHRNPKGRK